ncbi:unnamed protein product, partial [Prorocentrum cordatum]
EAPLSAPARERLAPPGLHGPPQQQKLQRRAAAAAAFAARDAASSEAAPQAAASPSLELLDAVAAPPILAPVREEVASGTEPGGASLAQRGQASSSGGQLPASSSSSDSGEGESTDTSSSFASLPLPDGLAGDGRVQLRVLAQSDAGENAVTFTLPQDAPLERLMEAWCKHQGHVHRPRPGLCHLGAPAERHPRHPASRAGLGWPLHGDCRARAATAGCAVSEAEGRARVAAGEKRPA